MSPDEAPARLARWTHGLRRRVVSAWYRARHRRIGFGRGCDIRAGFTGGVRRGGVIRFGERCVLDRGMTVESSGVLTVGDRVVFGHRCTVAACETVEIGEDTMIGELVSIRDHDHAFDDLDRPVREQGVVVAPVRIGRDVWIGGKATVLKGVTIGDQAVIGANAVVTADVPARAIAAGVPARVIGQRGSDQSTPPRPATETGVA